MQSWGLYVERYDGELTPRWEGVSDMDIKEIREWVRITEGEEQARNGGYYYSRYIKGRVEQIKFLLSEVERLEKENKSLRDNLLESNTAAVEFERQNVKLREENTKLKEAREIEHNDRMTFINDILGYTQVIQVLEEENKKLKEG